VASKANITALIGTSPMRIFPVLLPQALTNFPAIAYREVFNEPSNTFDGASTYDYHTIDFHFYGKTYSSMKTLYETFRSEIEDSVGTYDSVQIDHVWYQGSGLEDYLDDLLLWTKHMELKISVRR
jgi:hypothetical protein